MVAVSYSNFLLNFSRRVIADSVEQISRTQDAFFGWVANLRLCLHSRRKSWSYCLRMRAKKKALWFALYKALRLNLCCYYFLENKYTVIAASFINTLYIYCWRHLFSIMDPKFFLTIVELERSCTSLSILHIIPTGTVDKFSWNQIHVLATPTDINVNVIYTAPKHGIYFIKFS
jgi:hypothetical protein